MKEKYLSEREVAVSSALLLSRSFSLLLPVTIFIVRLPIAYRTGVQCLRFSGDRRQARVRRAYHALSARVALAYARKKKKKKNPVLQASIPTPEILIA